jgi:hypothetical protein
MNNPDHISYSLETIFLGLKYFNSLMRIRDLDPGQKKFGSGIRGIQNPGWKKAGSGIRKNIPDPQHCLCHRVLEGRGFVRVHSGIES